MSKLLSTTAVAVALALSLPLGAPVVAQTTENGEAAETRDVTVIERDHAQPGMPALNEDELDRLEGGGVALVPGEDFADREIRTVDGQVAGRVAYVAVDTESGRISYLLGPDAPAATPGDARYRALPGSDVRTENGQLVTRHTTEDIARLPQMDRQELAAMAREGMFGLDEAQELETEEMAELTVPEDHPPMLLIGPEGVERIGADGIPRTALVVDEQGASLANITRIIIDSHAGAAVQTILTPPDPRQELAFRTSPLSDLRWDAEREAFVAPQEVAEGMVHPSEDEARRFLMDRNGAPAEDEQQD